MLQETVTSVDGIRIGCWRSGEGPPLVLVHGTAADHGRWRAVLPAFEERFSVLAVDRRGRGESGDSDGYEIEQEFEDVAAVVDSLGESVDLLGHSYGALVALEAALLTENVRKLVLYDPGIEVASGGRRRYADKGDGARRAGSSRSRVSGWGNSKPRDAAAGIGGTEDKL